MSDKHNYLLEEGYRIAYTCSDKELRDIGRMFGEAFFTSDGSNSLRIKKLKLTEAFPNEKFPDSLGQRNLIYIKSD